MLVDMIYIMLLQAADFLAMQSLLDLSSEKLEREIPARPDIENDEGFI